ncbi:hypothetical protein CHLNCDRAFT_134704 [Chlorella variabilis]|uniref:Uncharacterized protein n=1 Tax=Chlorella variabilis TaxID=554065 RepID=E1ZGK3_CHLVA|nr:hypothetical protein CHLNCDRAFT_134704 [Chlorella variabilis]EFN54772.1 hypothetical protein CHLNCDRAFT_134704 [Chlorella variabilis]|eukprot:XP_005846874.1 hypothetical protein CHLNCDRAFT_134704 [Chlorella variabilis]
MASSQPDNQLTEQEAAIYDRQLRVWGVETQRRLSGAKVLIAGCSGLAAEVAKNIVLAGVGSVTLVDDTPCSRRPLSNFLIPGDAPADPITVAEASVATLAEMNPFVKVAALPGPPSSVLAADVLRQYDLLLLCGQPASSIAAADVLCREAGVAFYAGVCRGIFGWAFADLHQHRFVVEKKEEHKDGSTSKKVEERTESFATWQQATSCSLHGVNKRRLTRLYLIIRGTHRITVCCVVSGANYEAAPPPPLPAFHAAVISRFEQQHGRCVTAADAEQLLTLRQHVCGEAGVEPGLLPDKMLQAYAEEEEDMPAINAIVGGELGNELIKAVGGRNEPVNNFFLFSLAEGSTMGKVPIRLREVVYALSPYQQSVMTGLWKDLPHKAAHHAANLRDAVIFCVAPIVGIAYYCADYKEKEKLHHRF